MVQAGRYEQRITHYNVLRTISYLYGLPHAGASADAAPIVQIWKLAPHP
jgi:acid phosphatase